ncbi:CHASE domain-containing protein [Altererythrobacter sp. JGD-16]|uniref:histidine kinase n=2 Tax=Altererythrobacter lutimaris TaxID=2743979 RepID=A0A850HF31_9SPHN|nr:CHASE domain-containing protein [Altererythrobacter lutimaris]
MKYPRAVPIAIFLAILAITGLSVFAIEKGESQRERAALDDAAQSVAAAIDRRGHTSASYLRAGAALAASVEYVDLPLFRRFVYELRLDADTRGAEGIGWAEALTPREVASYEARIGDQMSRTIEITPAPDPGAQLLVPVTFLEPDTERNRRAFAYDMYSEPARRMAMDEAARSVRPVASAPIVLVQEGGSDEPGFLIYMPVFEDYGSGRRLKGFVFSPFNARDFLLNAVEMSGARQISVSLYDLRIDQDTLLATVGDAGPSFMLARENVEIANRPFALEIRAAHRAALSPLSMATLLFGLAVASLLMLLARLITQQAIEDENALERFAQQVSIRDSLTRELNHRVKNTLANVLSIISLTRRRTSDLDEFANGLEGRIRAISATHALLTNSEWGTTPIRAVIEVEVAPYSKEHSAAVRMSGPDLELAPNDALSLGLAIHELSTNAAKFGALSDDSGSVEVSWELSDEGLAIVHWIESGGPTVASQRKPGFGTDLIEKIVAHELRHPVDLEFHEDGVRCTLRVPIRERGDFQLRGNLEV